MEAKLADQQDYAAGDRKPIRCSCQAFEMGNELCAVVTTIIVVAIIAGRARLTW